MTDELLLLFGGREYDQQKLRAAARDIDAALKTDRICPGCRSLNECVMDARGWQAFFDEQASDQYHWPKFRYKRCAHQRQADAVQRERVMVAQRFQQRSFETFKVTDDTKALYETCKQYADALSLLMTNGLMLIGPPGTGKTHLAVAIAKVALAKGIPTAFVVVPKLLDEIRRSLREDADEEQRLMASVAERRLVVLDDLGAEKTTDWVRERLYLLINERYEKMLPTVVTSNCSVQELENRLGRPTVDRLAEMCQVVAISERAKSWRRKRST